MLLETTQTFFSRILVYIDETDTEPEGIDESKEDEGSIGLSSIVTACLRKALSRKQQGASYVQKKEYDVAF